MSVHLSQIFSGTMIKATGKGGNGPIGGVSNLDTRDRKKLIIVTLVVVMMIMMLDLCVWSNG